MSKEKYLQIRITEAEKKELHEAAEAFKGIDPETSSSQLVREAIREKVADVKRQLALKEEGVSVS